MITLNHTDAFLIRDASGHSYYGGDQRWFGNGKEYRKEAACGATTCANILGYLAQTREALAGSAQTQEEPVVSAQTREEFADSVQTQEELAGLAPFDLHDKNSFLEFMKAVYPYVRPGLIGIMPADFTRGAEEYSAARGFAFDYDLLPVPAASSKRPGADAMYRFLNAALADDLPVAFLNLSGGRVKNLDSYHWVTLVGLDDSAGLCRIVD
ncbi:MAG: hypothetical protein LBT52_06740, partial [Clostridiales Family XIII bacterium]|nr:hypothetical protein [Clostridiales Family XIII bacterium]